MALPASKALASFNTSTAPVSVSTSTSIFIRCPTLRRAPRTARTIPPARATAATTATTSTAAREGRGSQRLSVGARRRLLRAWARSKGFVMHEGSQRGWEKEYPAFKIFERGRSRHTALHLEGEVGGRRVRCLDYRYTTGSGKNRKTHHYSIVILDTGCPV